MKAATRASRILLRQTTSRALIRRQLTTEAAVPAEASRSSAPLYPYSSSVRIIDQPAKPREGPLMQHINRRLRESAPDTTLVSKHLKLFDRSNPRRALPGSVMTVTYYTSPAKTSSTTFSGVLLGIVRKNYGVDTSFRLRTVVARTGVEMCFKVSSTMIQDIALVSRADRNRTQKVSRSGSFIMRARRAKLYYLREQPKRMANPASAIKAREQQLARLKAKTNPEGSTQMQPPQLARAKKGKKGSKKGGKK